MPRKVALFAFNGDPMCFIHVLLNTLDMKKRDFDVRLIIEGSAAKLIDDLNADDHPLNKLYQEVKEKDLIHCVCKACANKMGTLGSAEAQELPICGSMNGHPAMADQMDDGYEVLIF